MAITAQDLIEQAREREGIIATAKEGIKKERIERFKSHFKTPSPVSTKVKKLDVKAGVVARKAVHLAAPRGLVKTLTTPKGTSKGRGRPAGTYKTRYVPGVGAVKVPTHIYKKMLAEAKAKRRLAEAQRQARFQQQAEAEQLAMSQDPRFQPQDSWVESPDIVHEQEVMQAQQQTPQQQQLRQMQQQAAQQAAQEQRPGVVQRTKGMFGRSRISLMESDRALQEQLGYPQQVQQQRPNVPQIHRPQINAFQRPVSPQVIVSGGKSPLFSSGGPSILSQGNEFNRRDHATIGFGG